MRPLQESYASARDWCVWDDGDIGTVPEESGRSVHVANTSAEDARYIVFEHNARLAQIETKDRIILDLRQRRRELEVEVARLQAICEELIGKNGDLEARNQRLHDAPCSCYEYAPGGQAQPDVTVTVEASKERPKPPARGGW